MKLRGRYRRSLRKLLLLDEPPERTARAYGLGVFIGFSPFVGLHTAIALLIAFLFKMNRLALLAGVYTNTPWTFVPVLAFGTALGAFLLGSDERLPPLEADGAVVPAIAAEFEALILPFLLGNLLLAAAFGLLGYAIGRRWLLSRSRRRSGRDSVPAVSK